MADDDKMLIDMYKERLELAGYVVTLSRNGEEALGKIREAKPDIVLLDIMMPKINGYEALASIKSDPATKDIPVIMLSALMRDFNREKAVEAGADDYLIKSEAMPADVITKIEQVLAKYSKTTALPGAISSNIPTPSTTLPGPAIASSVPLPDLPPKPVESPVPFVSVAPAPEAQTTDKIVFTPINSEEPIKEPEKPEKNEEMPIVKINSSVAPVTQSNPTIPTMPWEKEQTIQPLDESKKTDKKGQSLASIALVVVIAILLTTLVNDLAIYFFFFAKK